MLGEGGARRRSRGPSLIIGTPPREDKASWGRGDPAEDEAAERTLKWLSESGEGTSTFARPPSPVHSRLDFLRAPRGSAGGGGGADTSGIPAACAHRATSRTCVTPAILERPGGFTRMPWGTPLSLSPKPSSCHGTPIRRRLWGGGTPHSSPPDDSHEEKVKSSAGSAAARQQESNMLRSFASRLESLGVLQNVSLLEARRSLHAFKGWFHGDTHLTLTVQEDKKTLVQACGQGCEKNLERALRCDVLCALERDDVALSDIQVTSIRGRASQNDTEFEFIIRGMACDPAELHLDRIASRLLQQVDASSQSSQQRYPRKLQASKMSLACVSRRLWVFPGQTIAALLLLLTLLLTTIGTVSAFLSAPGPMHSAPRLRTTSSPASSPRLSPSPGIAGTSMMMGGVDASVLDVFDISTAACLGGMTAAHLKTTLEDKLEKVGVGPARGGSSRVAYRNGTVTKHRSDCPVRPLRALAMGQARNARRLLHPRNKPLHPSTVRARLASMIDSGVARAVDGMVFDEEAPVTSQLAKDIVTKMAEFAMDEANMYVHVQAILKNAAMLQSHAAAAVAPLQHAAAVAGKNLDGINLVVSAIKHHI